MVGPGKTDCQGQWVSADVYGRVSMTSYELVIGGILSEDSIAGLPGSSWTTEGNTTVLRAAMSHGDLARVLESLESLGLGLLSLRQTGAAEV
jgi:hypothetical protein